jgi:hypothetical protein
MCFAATPNHDGNACSLDPFCGGMSIGVLMWTIVAEMHFYVKAYSSRCIGGDFVL